MALSIIGTPAAAAATSITLPTHAVGDLIVVWAFRDGSTTVPTKPAAGGTVPTWTDIDAAAGANLCSARSAYTIATATNHTSGTWTNATGMAAIVLRGIDYTPIGATAVAGGTGNNTAGGTASITPQVTDGTSVLLYLYGHRTVTAWSAAAAGYTRQASVAAEVALNTKDTTTSDGAQAQAATTSSSSGWREQIIEVRALPSGAPPPLGKNSAAGSATTITLTTQQDVPSGAKILLQSANQGGNLLSSVSGGGLTWGIEITGANTNTTHSIAYADAPSGLAAGTVITATFGASSADRFIGAVYQTGLATGAGSSPTGNNETTAGWTSTAITVPSGGMLFGGSHRSQSAGSPVSAPSGGNLEIYDFSTADGESMTMVYQVGTGASVAASGTWSGGTTTSPFDRSSVVAYAAASGSIATITPAAINAAATTSGTIVRTRVLAPASNAAATVSATVNATHVLSATASAAAAVAGTIVRTRPLAAAASAVATVSATVNALRPLSPSSAASSTVSAVVTTATLFVPSVVAAATMAGSLVVTRVLAPTVNAVSTVTGNITFPDVAGSVMNAAQSVYYYFFGE